MNRQDLSAATKLHHWSDGGRHFRCARSISTVVIKGLEKLIANAPKDNATIYEVETSFGVPKHFKNEEDGEFNYLKRMVTELARNMELTEVPQLVDEWRKLDAAYTADKPNPRREAFFIDYTPEWTRTEMQNWSIQFKAKSFKEGIMTSNSFLGRLNDKRRKRLLIDGVYTAVDFKTTMISGHKADGMHTCLPELADAEEAKAADAAEEDGIDKDELAAEAAEVFGAGEALADVTAASVAALPSKVTENGWQVSYRTSEPEHTICFLPRQTECDGKKI